MWNKQAVAKEIDRWRLILNSISEDQSVSLTDEDVLEISRKLDELIVVYYRTT